MQMAYSREKLNTDMKILNKEQRRCVSKENMEFKAFRHKIAEETLLGKYTDASKDSLSQVLRRFERHPKELRSCVDVNATPLMTVGVIWKVSAFAFILMMTM